MWCAGKVVNYYEQMRNKYINNEHKNINKHACLNNCKIIAKVWYAQAKRGYKQQKLSFTD